LTNAPLRQKSVTDTNPRRRPALSQRGAMVSDTRVRPFSWHVPAIERPQPSPIINTAPYESNVVSSNYPGTTLTPGESNEAITPSVHPFIVEPFVQDAFTPLEELSTQEFDARYAYLDEFRADKILFHASEDSVGSFVPYSCNSFQDKSSEAWKQSDYLTCQLPPTVPGYVPVQNFAGDFDTKAAHQTEKTGADELVALGLYDVPSPLPPFLPNIAGPWTLPYRSSFGKGLKLEETFEPTRADDDDEDDDADGSVEEDDPYESHHTDEIGSSLGNHSLYFEQNGARSGSFAPSIEGNTWFQSAQSLNYGWI